MNAETFELWKGVALVSSVMLLSIVVVAAGLAILVFLTRQQLRTYKYIDLAIFDWLQTRTSQRRNKFMLFVTLLAKHQFLIPANLLFIIYFLLIGDHSWYSIRVAAIALSSLVLMLLLKQLFKRKRPLAPLLKAAKGLSFPSGHAIMAVTFYGFVIYVIVHSIHHDVLKYFLVALLIILILLIGFSRVYLRVHYVSDVIAGFIIGILWLLVSLMALKKTENYLKDNRSIDISEVQIKKRPVTRSMEINNISTLVFQSPYSKSPPNYHQRSGWKN